MTKLSLVDQIKNDPIARLDFYAAELAIQTQARIHYIINSRNIELAKLAKDMNITEDRLYEILDSDGNMHLSTLSRFLTVFDLSIEELYNIELPKGKKRRS